jgi:flagellar motor switch protein FliN/FliY
MAATVPEQRTFVPDTPAARDDQAALTAGLRLFADGFVEGAGPALTTVLNRPVSLAVAGVERVPAAAVLAQAPLPWVAVTVPYARGLTGSHTLILPLRSALDLVRAAIGDAGGQAEEFTAAGEDALRELLGQVLSACAATLTPVLRRTVSFGSVTVGLAEDGASLPPELADQASPPWLVRYAASAPDGFAATLMLATAEPLVREIAASAQPAGADQEAPAHDPAPSRLDLILDISLPVTVELGRARMRIQDILKLGPGSIIELEKSAGDPVELYVNDRAIAKGEVVVIDENFGIRLTSIVTASERIRTLR